MESLSSPQLMQYICLNICTILEMSEEHNAQIGQEILETAYRYTTANFEYGDVVSLMKKGPNTRGKSRNTFLVKDGQQCDIYELIVKSIAENPPIMKLEFEDVKKRIYGMISDDCKKPTPQAIKESLAKLQELLHGREDIFKVLDWKEGVLYILDPLFLFYLRLGESIEQIQAANDSQTFQRKLAGLREYLKELGVGTQDLLSLERIAYYPLNAYSDRETKENMEAAKQRVISYIENILCDNEKEEQVLEILNNFYLFLENLIEREPHKRGGIQQEQLHALKIKNEYDVQHLLYACIKLLYPMARAEVSEDTGYGTVRTDIFLDTNHVIEVKCTRKNMSLKKLTEEIEADMIHYNAENIYFFLYDKEKIIENPMVFKKCYEEKIKEKKVYIIIHQPKIM